MDLIIIVLSYLTGVDIFYSTDRLIDVCSRTTLLLRILADRGSKKRRLLSILIDICSVFLCYIYVFFNP